MKREPKFGKEEIAEAEFVKAVMPYWSLLDGEDERARLVDVAKRKAADGNPLAIEFLAKYPA